MESEIEILVERVDDLDFEEAADRDKFYDLVDHFGDRIYEIRSRPVASKAPNKAMLKLDELWELLDDTSASVAVAVAHLDDPKDPFKAVKRRRREEKRQQRRVDRVEEDLEKVEEKIRDVTSAFEEDG